MVRVSGPRAGDAITGLGGKLPEPRRAALQRLRHPQTKAVLDETLVLWFPGPEAGDDDGRTAPTRWPGDRCCGAA